MKHAKTKGQVSHRPAPERKICYKEFDTEQALKDEMENDPNIWVVHQYDVELKEDAQRAYENFVCGFLQYYDTEVRNGSVDHVVHFKWEQIQTAGQSKKNKVTVYLNPPALPSAAALTPGSFGSSTDPPSPSGPPPPPPGS